VSGKVNDKNVPIRYVLHNGDTVSVLTLPAQSPKRDWLTFVATSKARVKIKQALREEAAKSAEFGKEMFQRRLKNRKIEIDEGIFLRYIKKKGYKTLTDFYVDLSGERLDPNVAIEEYLEHEQKEKEISEHHPEIRSAEEYITTTEVEEISRSKDVLVIDQNLTGIEYKLAKCCNPIFGDEIFGFVSTSGIRIHRTGCPNEQEMRKRFGYRIIEARWSGKEGSGDIVNLRVIGRNDITIVTNITSVISKEDDVTLRSLTIDTVDNSFRGHFSILVKSKNALAQLTGKIKAVKGVKTVERLNA
jgi:GTP pyrophosphokinase